MNLSFTGEYRYSIDQKSRLNIPAKFRKALDPKNSNTFVITRGFDPSLILYPIVEWQKVEQQLLLLSSIKNLDRSFVRSIVRYATIAKYDSQGRIQIPENLLESELFGHEKGSFTGAHSLRKGRFEQCDGGTLFLDEIGDMPIHTQSKILRTLQSGEFSRVGGNENLTADVRILAYKQRPGRMC